MAPTGDVTAPVTPPVGRRRWLRRAAWALGLVLLLLLLAPLALKIGAVRGWVADRIGAALDRRVEIGGASAYWFRGIDLEDVTVHSPDGFDGPLAQVSKIHADVDVLSLLGGPIEARVRVVQPHVTLRRDAAGRSNAKDLGGRSPATAQPEAAPAPEAQGTLDVRLVLMGGSLEALDATGRAENALHDIQLTADVKPDGRRNLDVQANARGAGAGGADARIAALLAMDAEGTGLFKIDVPPLSLERLARLVEDTLDLADLTGSVEIQGEGTLHPDETVSGTLKAELVSVGARTAEGSRISVRRLVADARLRSVSQSTEADVGLALGDLRVTQRRDGRDESFREPEISARASARWNPKEKRLRIAEGGGIEGGRLVRVTLPEPLRLEAGASARFEGRMDVSVDLGRLGSLGGLVPALEPLAGGTLEANVQGTGGGGLDLGVGLLIRDLALRPSALAPEGYGEPRIVSAFRLQREDEQDLRLLLTQLQSQLLTIVPAGGPRGLAVTLGREGGQSVDGEFELRVELEALGRLLGSRMNLAPGERLGGRLRVAGDGRGTPQDMRLTARLRGEDVRVPPSWSRVATPATFDARLVVARTDTETQLTMSELQGMGLSGTATARLREVTKPAGATLGLREAEAQLTVDLGVARPWLGGLLGLQPSAALGGRVRTDVRIAAEAGGHHVVTTTQANELMVQPQAGRQAIREPRVTLRSDLHLAEAGGRHEARELKLDAGALQLDLSGSTLVTGPDADAQLRVTLGGDAERLAPTLAAWLGEGYEDLRGSGKLAGTVTLTGSTAAHGAALFPGADLALGSWSTAGLRVEKLLVRAERTDGGAPLVLTVRAGVNGGTADIASQLRLGTAELPWSADVRVAAVDTSSLLTSRGLGRYIAFALPALVPADAPVQVLSGRLDAELHGEAPAWRGDALRDGLRGRGTVTMQQGEIKQSTLFGGGADGSLGKLVTALRVAVPEAGAVLSEVSKAVTFETLESTFTAADRVLRIERTHLQGRRVVVEANGTVGFDERLDLQAKVVLQGSAGEKLAKVAPGGAIPLRIAGTLEKPQVQPRLDPGALVGAPGGKDGLLDRIKDRLPDLPKPPKLPDLPKPPKLPKLPNPFK